MASSAILYLGRSGIPFGDYGEKELSRYLPERLCPCADIENRIPRLLQALPYEQLQQISY
jgi:hypothetical protein